MCGIVGAYWHLPPEQAVEALKVSLRQMKRRGPDGEGLDLLDVGGGLLGLGHTRLSIIDPTPAGRQPMTSRDGLLTIVFNGEIYNYVELREQLRSAGSEFSTESDTEVLLEAWRLWGTSSLRKLIGMFAFAVFDRRTKCLTCVRDPYGIKPLFYWEDSSRFLFSSEQRPLWTLMPGKPQPNWQRCYDYLVPGDFDSAAQTFVEGVRHLRPGHLLTASIGHLGRSVTRRWWAPSSQESWRGTYSQAVSAIRNCFLDSMRLHMRSDVPVGAALSGGVDSSAVVCAMRRLQPRRKIHTFSFVARNQSTTEERWVDMVNSHVRAVSHKIVISARELAEDLDDLVAAQAEPFGSPAVYGQYRVFKRARETGIVVTLDGQGADELLAGYIGYPGYRLLSLLEEGRPLAAIRFARQWGRWPNRAEGVAWSQLRELLTGGEGRHVPPLKLRRQSEPPWIDSRFCRASEIERWTPESPLARSSSRRRVAGAQCDALTRMGLGSLLRHADRAAMRFSVESRVPFLTVPMADLLLGMPEEYLISERGETKSIFRVAMRGLVPQPVLARRDKIGFGTPNRAWLLELADVARRWLRGPTAPFVRRDVLLDHFEAIVRGAAPFTWRPWCWIIFARWYQQMGFD